MKKLLITLFFVFITSFAYAADCKVCHAAKFDPSSEVLEVAKKYLNVREKTNKNDHPKIDQWVKENRANIGDPYCQSFFNSIYKEVYNKHKLKSPWFMTAGVSDQARRCTAKPFDFYILTTTKMNWTNEVPKPGDLASWKHGSSTFSGFSYKGHAGLVTKYVSKNKINTIEGNTKSGPGGDQSGTVKGDMRFGHEGVYARERSTNTWSKFPIVYFIRSK